MIPPRIKFFDYVGEIRGRPLSPVELEANRAAFERIRALAIASPVRFLIARSPPAPLFVCQCMTCGTSYTPARWALLELKGNQKIDADAEGPAEVLELRQCACGSTLAVKWNPPPVSEGR